MVAEVASIEVSLKLLNVEAYQSSMRGAGTLTEQTGQRVVRSMDAITNSTTRASRAAEGLGRGDGALRSLAASALRADTSITALTRGLQAAGVAVGGLAGGVAVNAFKNYADQATNIRNRLATAVPIQEQRLRIENEIYQSAQRSRTSYEATANLFSRLTISAGQLGANQAQILRVVETTQKALITGGATVQEAAAVATQLTQALGSGRLAGDELRSIAENSPVLIQSIAKEFGVSVGALKDLGSQGQLEATRVFSAILNSTDDVERAFARTTPTIAAGIQQIDNALVRYIGSVDQSLGATEKLVSGLQFVAANLNNIGDSAGLAVAAVAGSLLGRGAGRAVTAVRRPFQEARAEADARVDAARESQQQARFRQQAAFNRYFEALANREVVSATPSLALAGAKPIADLEAAEKRLAGSREALRAETGRLTSAEAARDAVANASLEVRKQLINAEQAAARALGDTKQRVAAQALEYQVAAGGTFTAEGSLTKAEADRFAKASTDRAAAQARMAEIDAANAAARRQIEQMAPTAAPVARRFADRSAAMGAEIEQMTASRNRLGLALRGVERDAMAAEEQLAQANLQARGRHNKELERLGAELVANEQKVAEQRRVVAERASQITGYSATGNAMSGDAVLKQIEREISAQERLAALEAKSADLGTRYNSMLDRAPQVSGSLNADQVRNLSALRQQRASMIAELAQMDADLDSRRRQRETLDSRIGPSTRARLAIDAENAPKVAELNAGIQATANEREALATRLERTNATIEGIETKLEERTSAARQRAFEQAQAAADGLRKVQTALVQDLDTLNQRRSAIAEAEVANETRRAERLKAIDAAIAQRRQQISGIQGAVRGYETGAQQAREAVTLSGQGKIEDAERAARSAEASITLARRAADEAVQNVARAQRAASTVAVLQAVAGRSLGALSGLVSFLGGPAGAALTAASVGLAGYALYQARAEAETKKHADAVKILTERTEALNKAKGAAKIRDDRRLAEDRITQVDAAKAARDGRDTVRNALDQAQRSAALAPDSQQPGLSARDLTTVDVAAQSLGINLSKVRSDLERYSPLSTEAADASRSLADALSRAALVDPKLLPIAKAAQEAADKMQEAAKASRDYAQASQQAANVKLPDFLNFPGPFTVMGNFKPDAGNAAVKAYLEELGDEIDKVNGTPIRLEGLDTSAAEVRSLVEEMAAGRAQVLGLVSGQSVPSFLSSAIEQFKDGATTSAEFGAKLVALKEKYPDFSPLIQSLIEANERLLKAQAEAAGLGLNLDKLDGKVISILINMATSGKIPDLAAEAAKAQAAADKVVADQEFNSRVNQLRAQGKDIEADTLVQQAKTPKLDVKRYQDNAEQERIDKIAMEEAQKVRQEAAGAAATAKTTIAETRETRMKAQGKEREAAISRYVRENPGMNVDVARRLAGDQYDADQELAASKKAARGAGKKSKEEKDAETLEKKLRELDQDARVAGLDTFDQKTVRFAQDAKVASDQIEAFITAARSGNLSDIPPVMQQIYEKMMLLEGVKLAKSALDDLFPYRKMARELEELRAAANASPEIAANIGLIEMQIQAKNAPEWISGLSDGVKDMAKSIADNSATIGDAMEALKRKIIGLALDAAFKPLEMGFKGLLTSLTSSMGGASPFSFLMPGAGAGSSGGDFPLALGGADDVFGGFDDGGYTGWGPRRKPAGIVHAGEVVWSQDDVLRAGGVHKVEAARLSGLPGYERGGVVEAAASTLGIAAAQGARQAGHSAQQAAATSEPSVKLIVNEAPGGDKVGSTETRRGADGSIEVVADMLDRRSADKISRNRGPISGALQARGKLRGA